jgi:hypothetical protein
VNARSYVESFQSGTVLDEIPILTRLCQNAGQVVRTKGLVLWLEPRNHDSHLGMHYSENICSLLLGRKAKRADINLLRGITIDCRYHAYARKAEGQ